MLKSSKASKPARKPGGGAALMQQMGFQVPNFDESGMGGGDDDDDDDLEAELQKLQQGDMVNPKSRGSKSNQRQLGGMAQDLQSFHNDVNKLLRDIDRPINDDELSDVDDEDLLAELNEITDDIQNERHDNQKSQSQTPSSGNMVSLLVGRQEMYVKAVAGAKSAGDAAKARRLDRQLKTIQELLQSARTGAPINEKDIPPEVFISTQTTSVPQQMPVRAPSPPPQLPASRLRAIPVVQPTPAPPVSARATDKSTAFKPQPQSNFTDTDPAVARLKSLALQAKQQGDMAKAKEYIVQLRALQSKATPTAPSSTTTTTAQKETYDNVAEDDGPPPSLPLKAPEPRTIMEALQQRHEELAKRGEEAARTGDNSKARRMERLSKQYEEAIDATRKGRPYNYTELPDLPGFAPIPVQQGTPQPTASVSSAAATTARPASSNTQVRLGSVASSNTAISARKSQQAIKLRLKQEKFQKLALKAKQSGDIETAKKFLVACRGLEPMIEAADAGLPVDMSQVPKLPGEDANDMIDDDDLTQDLAHADRDTIYRRLQEDLLQQIQLCARNQQIYAQMEGANSLKHSSEYKILEQRCAGDLDKLRHCFQHGIKPPLFHYERRQMNVIQANNDLGDNDLEVTILRGINLPVPTGFSSATLETYVMIEFPYPTETPQTGRTRHTVGSINAEYPESEHKFYIKRNDAKFRRLMSRKELKLAVFYKPGFLRSDRPLGTASIKLAALEQTCTIHESVDLFESEHKKKIEGKLEIKLRIKEALGQTKASDILPQRWLVIDRFEESSRTAKPPASKSPGTTAPAITAIACLKTTGEALGQLAINMAKSNNNSDDAVGSSQAVPVELTDRQRRRAHQHNQRPATTTYPQSVQVLNYEASLIQQQIEQLQDRLTHEQIHQLKMRRRDIEEQSDRLVDSLRMGGRQAVQEHVRNLEELNDYYDQEARENHQRRETKKADISLTKKKLVMKEIETLTGQPASTRF
ncbi:unnamed protein product [Rotaria socialis]|uniref:C2 domain-containing protein n=5 Tax=Rotaria socialis TaxID=392032 RepID=A0A820T7J1_9BILA|nr:unnamed protein product [Rotaria socialis]CAF4470490.1 unnamed protein product [Rotaria socialis]